MIRNYVKGEEVGMLSKIPTEFVWLIISLLALFVEVGSFQLITIWFSFGALVCIPFAMLGAPLGLQIALFFGVSIISMYALKPWAKTHFKPKEYRSLIGSECILTEDCDLRKGKTKIGDVEWQVRSDVMIPKGTIVIVTEVEGVKLIVKEKQEV